MRYISNQYDITGTNGERRVQEVLAKGQAATQTYELKDTSKKFNNSMQYYTDAQIEFAKRELKDMLYFFGYAKPHYDKDNKTGFFEFDKETDQAMAGTYKQHQNVSESVIEWVSTMGPDLLREFQYQLGDKNKEVELLSFATTAEAGKAINDWSERQLYGKSYTNCK